MHHHTLIVRYWVLLWFIWSCIWLALGCLVFSLVWCLPNSPFYSDMEYPDGAGRAWMSGSSGAQWGLALQI